MKKPTCRRVGHAYSRLHKYNAPVDYAVPLHYEPRAVCNPVFVLSVTTIESRPCTQEMRTSARDLPVPTRITGGARMTFRNRSIHIGEVEIPSNWHASVQLTND